MYRFLAVGLLLSCAGYLIAQPPQPGPISWKKTVIDTAFRSEGVTFFDVNKDGKKDILVGEFWYEAPDWKRHELQTPGNYGDGQRSYSKVFCCWGEDLNGDGYTDLIVVDFPGAPCYWLENPKGQSGHWKKHPIWHSACNETPQYVDLFGTGKRVLIMGFQPREKPGVDNEGRMAYFTPNGDPYKEWDMHPISSESVAPKMKDGKPVPGTGHMIPGTQRFSHGLGVGDINGDGRLDVICTGGWWEQPEKADGTTPWKFRAANLGPACADMFAIDIDNDTKADIVSTSAHQFGIWWHKQRGDGAFERRDLFPQYTSETHAAHFVDIDGDGLKDLVTGKRWWSHGRSEPGSDWPAMLYWFKAKKSKDGMIDFTPYIIDTDSGVGTQFAVGDVNGDGLLDIVISNKKGVSLHEQVRKK
ncbi:MAG: VCBS repeat-containing protein [Planctomycetia bacterium]|nr:VCBS repeat-containing protein [Planctomycetia bacterium]